MAESALHTSTRRVTYGEYLRWKREDTLAEWVDGEVILLMPPKNRHQDIVSFLGALLRVFLDLTGLGKVLPAPFEVYLPKRPASREPDLVVVLGENLRHLSEGRFTGVPNLLVETISAENVRRDMVEKFLKYEREPESFGGSRSVVTLVQPHLTSPQAGRKEDATGASLQWVQAGSPRLREESRWTK